jgi:tRNA pseudouridine55 synthase
VGRRKKGRELHGILVLNKPAGLSSNQALQQVRRLFDAKRAGHTGALDPLATGVLPLCFGEATKFSQLLLEADKAYSATFCLGVETDSYDSDGALVSQLSPGHLTNAQIMAALAEFQGAISQVPPMVSALKHKGRPLYELAREGVEIERSARAVNLYRIDVKAIRSGLCRRFGDQECPITEVDLDVRCSKGTYIRSLAHDLGRRLGVGAIVSRLHRTQAGPFCEDDAVTVEQVMQWIAQNDPQWPTYLAPVDAAVQHWPACYLAADDVLLFRHGRVVPFVEPAAIPLDSSQPVEPDCSAGAQGGKVRVFSAEGEFLGIAHRVIGQGPALLQPERVMVMPDAVARGSACVVPSGH